MENTSRSGLARALRDATEHFLVGDASAVADELTDSLLAVSGLVAGFRKRLPAQGALAGEMGSIDQAFAQSIAVARRLSLAIRAHRDPGAFTDVARMARDLGRHHAPAMPDGVAFTIVCPSPPTLVAMPQPDMRRVLTLLVRHLVEGLGECHGNLTLEVAEVREGATSPASVRVQIGHPKLRPAVAAEAADEVRAHVNATGGSVEPCARLGGGAAVVVLLPSAC